MSELRSELLSQLNTLHRLTSTEEMIAQVRRVQATSDTVERELAHNAEKCRERITLLRDLITELGGVHDVVGSAVGRLSATAKAQLEQGTTLPEALFSDLALEHQLLDRARFVKLLAKALDEAHATTVMDRLETAHTATIEWIEAILAEVAVGAPTKLRPTPAQVAVATGRRVAFFGARRAAYAVNRSVAAFGNVQHRVGQTAEQVQQRVGQTAGDAVDKLQRLRRDTNEVVVAGRDAALSRAEEVAREEGAGRTAEAVRDTRESLGALRAEELPIKGYDALNAGMAAARIEKLDEVHDVQVVLTYEQASKNRASVVRAAQARTEELTPQFSETNS
ncbi:MAG: ferritin-like domain-containing protein [Frankiaceae bacterium]